MHKHQWIFDTSVEFQNLKSNWGMSFSLSYLLTFDRQLIPQISLIIGLESSGSVALSFSFFTEQLNKPYFIPINIPIEAQLLVKLELWCRGIFSTSIFNLPLSNKPQRQAESHQQRSNQISILFGKNTLARVLKLGVSPSWIVPTCVGPI